MLVDLGNKPFIRSNKITILLQIQKYPRIPFLSWALVLPLKKEAAKYFYFEYIVYVQLIIFIILLNLN